MMQIRPEPPTLRSNRLRQHLQHRVERPPRKTAIRISTLDQRKQFVLIPPVFGIVGAPRTRAARHNLLRKHVQRALRKYQPIELPRANPAHEYGAFRQIVTSSNEESSLRNGSSPVTAAA